MVAVGDASHRDALSGPLLGSPAHTQIFKTYRGLIVFIGGWIN